MRILSFVTFAVCMMLGLNATAQSFEVGGVSYTAFAQGERVHVALSPVEVHVVRNEFSAPPPCKQVDDILGLTIGVGFLEECTNDPDGEPCNALLSTVNDARRIAGVIGESIRQQSWRIETASTASPLDAAAVINAAADATGRDAGQIHLIQAPEGQGLGTNLIIRIDTSGTSYASQLGALSGFDEADLQYQSEIEDSVLRTNDNILACAMLKGDITLEWDQAPAPGAGETFDAAQLQGLQQQVGSLISEGANPIEHAVLAGAALGAALRGANLVDEALAQRVRFLLANFFEGGDALRFRTALGAS